MLFKPRTFLVSYKTSCHAWIGQKRAQSSCNLWIYSNFRWLRGEVLHHRASRSQWRCRNHRELACLLKTLSAWLLSVNLWFLLLLFPQGRSLADSLLRFALQRSVLNRWSWTLLSLVTDAVTCHSTQTDSQRFHLETPEEPLCIGGCVWARWSLFTLIGRMQITGESWASFLFSKNSLQISISIDQFNIDDSMF